MYKDYFPFLKNIILSDIGIKGQDLIKNKKILCIGTGGLGSPVLTYLPSIGIKEIGIIEFDKVDVTNLNRQFIFNDSDINKKKIICAKAYLKKKKENLKIKTYEKKLSYSNSFNIFKKYDIVIDCTDNIESKIIISDSAIKLNIPVVHASVFGFEGYISILKRNILCYRCLYENYKSSEYIEYGILGPIAGAIGCIQVIETAKLILNSLKNKEFNTLESKMLILDFKKLNIKVLNILKKKKCKICQD